MQLTRKLIIHTTLLSSILLFSGCTDGEDAKNALINTTNVAVGGFCDAGGVKIDVGSDDNNDGVLDPSEIDSTSYVCNGDDGATGATGVTGADGADGNDGNDGAIVLSRTLIQEDFDNCPIFGEKTVIHAGHDDNLNGILDPDEVDDSVYICSIESFLRV